MDIFGTKAKAIEKERVSSLENINNELIHKTSELVNSNIKMNNLLTTLGYNYELLNGETNKNDLPIVKELIFCYDELRLRSWQFALKNHIAALMIKKRNDWMLGSGLLFNAKPSEKPFIKMYGEELGKQKHSEFISETEFQYRNLIKTTAIDYSRELNMGGLSRKIDYNGCNDGDVLLLMRVRNGYPNIQAISGQCLENPFFYDIPETHTINNGVEKNDKDEVVAYHVLIDTNTSNSIQKSVGDKIEYGTRRIPVYFKNTNIKQAWLYSASDLKKLGETRGMPILADKFESLQHVNDYIIANAKNAQLKAQMVIAFEKDASSDGQKIFQDTVVSVGGMDAVTTTTTTASDSEVALNVIKATNLMEGNGIVFDPGRGVKAKMINDTAQSDQKEYLDSTLRTIFASGGTPYEVMISSYDSNYSASMGARSDYQHILDVMTEMIPSAQLYKMHYNMFLYLQILKGDLICEPLKQAYAKNDIINIQALSNSTFEGTKLKPIDPVKFIKSLREQLPESVRNTVALNTIDNVVNQASGSDHESVNNQVTSEIKSIPESFKIQVKPSVIS